MSRQAACAPVSIGYACASFRRCNARSGVSLSGILRARRRARSDGGDLAALVGIVSPLDQDYLPVRGGRLTLEGDSVVALTAVNDTLLQGTLLVRGDGFYRISLDAEDGTRVAGTIDYAIDAIDDARPYVSIRKPGRDTRPTSVEEVFIEAAADDDYGVAKLELVYRVNGGEEQIVPLSTPNGAQKEISAAHTIYLEELKLQPGDIVSYYARATDNNAITGAQSAASDIYFATVRPFDRTTGRVKVGAAWRWRRGVTFSVRCAPARDHRRDIQVERDRATMEAREMRENVATLLLSQAKLREQVDDLSPASSSAASPRPTATWLPCRAAS